MYLRLCHNATVDRPDLKVQFLRGFEDHRDYMSDSIKPDMIATDNFDICIFKMNTYEETKDWGNAVTTIYHHEVVEKFEIKSITDKNIANYIWYLAKKQNASYEDLKALHEAHKI